MMRMYDKTEDEVDQEKIPYGKWAKQVFQIGTPCRTW
jgi:hypothetical protein